MLGPRASGPASRPLFGREEIVEEVHRMVALAREGQGSGLLLVGDTGSGKSQALRSVVEGGVDPEFRVLSGHALPEELPAPFSMVRDLLRSMSEGQPQTSADPEGAVPHSIFLAPFGEGVSTRPRTTGPLPITSTVLDDLERILAPVGPDAVEGLGGGREHLLGQVEGYFLKLARDRPLLIAIDDLHLADTSSLEFLWRFTTDLPHIRAVVVATVCAGAEVPERTRAALESLHRSPAIHSMPLRPLSVPEVTELVRWIRGGRVPDPEDVRRWHAQADGNPLFIEQLVRSATGFGTPAGRGSPTGKQDVIGILVARVRALAGNERRVLTYAAVLGKEVRFSDLMAVAGLGEDRVTESLDRLVENGLLREKGHEVYEFVTEAVRASVYADLTETRRRILHEKAGLALEAKGDASDFELARQFYLGRDNDRAVKYNIAAAQSATWAFAFETAVAHLARAVEAERQRPAHDVLAEVRILTEQGRLLNELGSPHRSEEVLTEAVDLARSHTGNDLELGRALLGLAQSRYMRGEYPSAEALATEAWTYLPKVGTMRDLMAGHRVLGLLYWRLGKRQLAEAHQRAVLEIAEREGTPLERGHALIDLANSIPSGPAGFDRTLELYARAANLFAEGENHGARARVLMNRAATEWEAGRTDEALKDFALAIEAAERAHSPTWLGYCQFNLAQLQVEVGRVDLARLSLERAHRVLAPIRDRFAEQQMVMGRGMIAQAERSFDLAEVRYRKSLELAHELQLPGETSEVLFRLAQLSHDRGDDAEARKRLAEARASGLLDLRPDFVQRVAALERSLAASPANSQ